MNVDRQALKNADPLHEGMQALDEGRARMRQAVLSAASTARPAATRSSTIRRLLVVAPAVLILLLSWTATRLWSPGGASLQAAQIRLEVRLAEQEARPGLARVAVPDSDRVLYLHREVLVTNADVAQTGVVEGEGGFAVRVELTQAAGVRMRRATEAHVGKPIVILLDGAVAMAPILRSPIEAVALITGDYTRESAERLAEGLARR